VLAALSGEVSPQLLDRGEDEGRECLAVEWCAGIDVLEASAELRDTLRVDELLDLGERVLKAYARLHREGFLHGDVHPRNILVEADGRVRLIDFGLAARFDAPDRVPRGGIDLFLEPELASARLAGLPAPPVSLAGEQYSVAALVYLVLTGAHTHVFSLDERRMHRQLLEDPPLRFAVHDARGVELVEPVLARALSKRPGDRFESMEALRDSYHAARKPSARSARKPVFREAQLLTDDVLARLAGPLAEEELEPPTASVNLGAAGLAYGALRIAAARDEPCLLAVAERWAARAALSAEAPAGFENPELDITPEKYGRSSLYHSSVGVHCVGALVARARGDELLQTVEIEQLAASIRAPRRELDVAFGASGGILGCALVVEAVPGSEQLAAAGDEIGARLAGSLRPLPPIADAGAETPLGTAHGWAGYLFALLRWSEARGLPAPPEAGERLDQLASFGVPFGRGLRWPREVGLPAGENALGASWCNGAAGLVHLWLVAERVLGEARFARLAEAAAWTAYDAPDAGGDLCCGAAGRAYALLAVHRQLGGRAWLDRSIALAERAARAVRRDPLRRDSLYKGEVGVAVLAADLARPDWAAMPLFESEGWPRTS
jgi:serine/threonine-protein kinase